MDAVITTLIGVFGTLAGTLLGWLLNAQSYKIGRTKIFATLVTSVEIPPARAGDGPQARRCGAVTRYLFQCVALNSRQIPVILENFYVEMRTSRCAEPVCLRVLKEKTDYTEVNGLKIGAEVALPRQYIPPRTLHEFTFRVDYRQPDIQYSRLELVACNERHKRQRFLLYDGWKRTPPPPA